jgi:hypothetical protein
VGDAEASRGEDGAVERLALDHYGP